MVKGTIDKIRGRQSATAVATDTAAAPGPAAPQPAAQPQAPPPEMAPQPAPAVAEPRPEPPPYPVSQAVLADEPFVSADTGTIAPGMAERDVYSLWGAPVATRRSGEWTYLYFRNGCEYSCGTFDVVFLQNGQVVDAVLRWPGHGYSGVSSSPPDRLPEATPPGAGDTLVVPAPPPSP
ncbi:MAG: hypothetical protein ACREMR_10535 [Gemmatimonadales bacterium]